MLKDIFFNPRIAFSKIRKVKFRQGFWFLVLMTLISILFYFIDRTLSSSFEWQSSILQILLFSIVTLVLVIGIYTLIALVFLAISCTQYKVISFKQIWILTAYSSALMAFLMLYMLVINLLRIENPFSHIIFNVFITVLIQVYQLVWIFWGTVVLDSPKRVDVIRKSLRKRSPF